MGGWLRQMALIRSILLVLGLRLAIVYQGQKEFRVPDVVALLLEDFSWARGLCADLTDQRVHWYLHPSNSSRASAVGSELLGQGFPMHCQF